MAEDNCLLTLGVIGLSAGNGHPYSWSAIINGYDPQLMADCGYPVIPDYLGQQVWPDARIETARVTHIWTQDTALSKKIAAATYIDTVVESITDLIGQVDGILLARDDAVNHVQMATPFLQAGLPVYIDKPICLSLSDLDKLFQLQQYPGQIFSCSALRYANELKLTESEIKAIGRLRYIQALTPKDWDCYSVHLIEPLLSLIGEQGELLASERYQYEDFCTTRYDWESGLHASVTTLGNSSVPITFKVIGETGFKDLIFNDTFSAFKAALTDFIEGIASREQRSCYQFMRKTVTMIAAGRESETMLRDQIPCRLV